MLCNDQIPFIHIFVWTQSIFLNYFVCYVTSKRHSFVFSYGHSPKFLLCTRWIAQYCDERVCVSACLCVCWSASTSPELHVRSSPTFCTLLPIAAAQSSSGCVAICYVLAVFLLWMPSFVHTMAKTMRRKKEYTQIGSTEGNMDLTAWHILKVTHHGQHRTGSENLIFLRLPCFHTLEITAWTKLSRAALHFCT